MNIPPLLLQGEREVEAGAGVGAERDAPDTGMKEGMAGTALKSQFQLEQHVCIIAIQSCYSLHVASFTFALYNSIPL